MCTPSLINSLLGSGILGRAGQQSDQRSPGRQPSTRGPNDGVAGQTTRDRPPGDNTPRGAVNPNRPPGDNTPRAKAPRTRRPLNLLADAIFGGKESVGGPGRNRNNRGLFNRDFSGGRGLI